MITVPGHSLLRVLLALVCACAIAPAAAMAQTTVPEDGEAPPAAEEPKAAEGGVKAGDPRFRPPKRATIRNGLAVAPRRAPRAVKRAIAAANRIVRKPYKWGGGHASVEDRGYDCSGTVSYALIHAKLLKSPMPSGGFMRWGKRGKGRWITVYANGGHMYAVIAGLRLDTGMRDPNAARYGTKPGRGPRWNRSPRSPKGFAVRHPAGF